MSKDPLAVSLAVLRVNWDRRGQDFLENFVPFVVEGLRMMPQDEVSLVDVEAALHEEFGLSIPLGPLRTILRRLSNKGLLRVETGIFLLDRDQFPPDDLAEARSRGSRRYQAAVNRYVRFCAENLGREVSEDEAKIQLERFVDRYSIPFLRSAIREDRPTEIARSEQAQDYMLGAFVNHANQSDPECFEFLVEIAKGAMLAEAIYAPDVSAIAKRFRDTRVYLDTTLLIRALGYSGPNLERPFRALIDGLRESGAKPRCFKVTLKETKGILYANAMRMRGGSWRAYGETVDHFRAVGISSSDVMALCDSLEEALHDIGVPIEERPPHQYSLTLNEGRLAELLQQGVGYHNQEALQHDINVLTAIYRARDGAFPRFIEDCEALFVTTNASLVAAMRLFMSESFAGEAQGVPLAIGDHAMGTVIWLKRPIEMPDLPRDKVIADCHAALNPPAMIWRIYFDELDRLLTRGRITPEEHAVLRSLDAERALMDLTLGDVDAFAEGTVDEVLERARDSLRKGEVDARRNAERQLAEEAAARAEEAAAREAAEQADAATHTNVRRQAERVASWVGWGVKIAALIALAAISALALPKPLSSVTEHLPSFTVSVLLGLFAVVGVIDLVFGRNIHTWVKGLEKWLAHRIYRSMTDGSAPEDSHRRV